MPQKIRPHFELGYDTDSFQSKKYIVKFRLRNQRDQTNQLYSPEHHHW